MSNYSRTVARQKNWANPDFFTTSFARGTPEQRLDKIEKFLKKHFEDHMEESTVRLLDFSHVIDGGNAEG